MRWSNAFSYSSDNSIRFDASPLTQLVGKNGHGKSSIALLIEEVLFNKNSKGIKKADIINRHLNVKQYTIELDFSIDNDDYTIKSVRGSTQTVKLYKNGEDVSSHTSTATYKNIEMLLGLDHKAFTQIVYQSNASSLEFLTATDSNRKKFLIELLNLEKYSKASDVFKGLANEVSKEVANINGKLTSVNDWLKKYSSVDLNEQPICQVPELSQDIINKESALLGQISIVDSSNKMITQNNTYKEILSKINIVPKPDKPKGSVDAIKKEITESSKESKDAEAFISKIKNLHGNCPTCLQPINEKILSTIIAEQEQISTCAKDQVNVKSKILRELEEAVKAYNFAVKSNEEWEKYHALVDTTLPEATSAKEDLDAELSSVRSSIKTTREAIAKAEKFNIASAAHNSKISVIKSQLEEFNSDLVTHTNTLDKLTDRLALLNILTKTFSTTGLVAYKIECLVKDLEDLTNKYLVDLSDGRFQLSFQINSSDKLNVVINDNGRDIDILALSGGERARVNAAALLAIRKLMQSLSNARINLLILDETVEALDVDGKERLIEVLLKEESLNTFLVSHGYTHALLEKVVIIKENNISRIEV